MSFHLSSTDMAHLKPQLNRIKLAYHRRTNNLCLHHSKPLQGSNLNLHPRPMKQLNDSVFIISFRGDESVSESINNNDTQVMLIVTKSGVNLLNTLLEEKTCPQWSPILTVSGEHSTHEYTPIFPTGSTQITRDHSIYLAKFSTDSHHYIIGSTIGKEID